MVKGSAVWKYLDLFKRIMACSLRGDLPKCWTYREYEISSRLCQNRHRKITGSAGSAL